MILLHLYQYSYLNFISKFLKSYEKYVQKIYTFYLLKSTLFILLKILFPSISFCRNRLINVSSVLGLNIYTYIYNIPEAGI